MMESKDAIIGHEVFRINDEDKDIRIRNSQEKELQRAPHLCLPD